LFSEVFKDEYFVIEASSGAEGLEILKSEHIDLIISDQAMPHMTGVEFFEKALLIDPGPNRILLTAFKDLNALAEAVNRAKIFRYVNKPWNKADLQNIMDSAIQEYQLRIKNEQLTERLKFHTAKLRESVSLKNQLLADLEISKSELEVSEMKLKRIIELSPLPIAISDLNNVNLVLNNQFIETFGYTLDDIPTINEWYIRAYPDIEYRESHISKWKNQLAVSLKNKTVMNSLESIVVCKKGDKKAIQITASIIGENLVAIFNDLTKIRHLEEDISFRIIMEEEIMRAKVAAESANKAKSEFIASMSHEIRTPMNAILGYAEVLSNELKEPIQVDYVKSIQSSGKTLLSLINDILDFSRIEAGKIELHKDAVNIRNLIQENRICVMATVSEGQPHCSLMSYAVDADCREIYMATHKETKKYRNLAANPSVSLLIDSREAGSEGQTKALTVTGTIQGVIDEQRKAVIQDALLKRHPDLKEFFVDPASEIIVVRVKALQLLDGITDAYYESVL